MLFSLMSIALAAPKEPFVAVQPPMAYSDLAAPKRIHRLWWESDGPADIQYLHKGQWKELAADVQPGYTTKALPLNTAFRISSSSTQKWSEPFQAPPFWSPSDIAGLGGSSPILSQTIGELVLDAQSHIWASTLGGGLLRVHTGHKTETILGPFEGLPSAKVISVDAKDNRVLVGTSEGTVLLTDGTPTRYWKSELPNPYTQSVRIIGDSYWMGTYEGLFIDTPTGSQLPLSPLSTFSIEALGPQDVVVGYQGLQRIDETYEARTWLDSQKFHAYDMLYTGTELYIATPEKGVLKLIDDSWTLVQNEDVTQLAMGVHGLWMAAGYSGLVHSSGQTFGQKEGLAGDAVWSVATQGQSVWAGTNGGLSQIVFDESANPIGRWSLPISTTPIERTAQMALIQANGLFFAGESGVWSLGRAHRYANNLSVAAPSPTLALLEYDKSLWAFGEQSLVWMDHKGHLDRINLSETPNSVALWQDQFWLATDSGVFKIDPDTKAISLPYPKAKVHHLEVYNDSLWGIGATGELVQFTPNQLRPFIQTGYATALSASGEALCVGTENGLERYWHRRDDKVEDVLGDGDLGIDIEAVAGDGAEGCWFGGEEGTVGWVGPSGAATKIGLPGLKSPTIHAIVPIDDRSAWVLTSKGTWRIRLNQ